MQDRASAERSPAAFPPPAAVEPNASPAPNPVRLAVPARGVRRPRLPKLQERVGVRLRRQPTGRAIQKTSPYCRARGQVRRDRTAVVGDRGQHRGSLPGRHRRGVLEDSVRRVPPQDSVRSRGVAALAYGGVGGDERDGVHNRDQCTRFYQSANFAIDVCLDDLCSLSGFESLRRRGIPGPCNAEVDDSVSTHTVR